jgi:predicted RNase H-like nuclease (RuvC/YqgF family)
LSRIAKAAKVKIFFPNLLGNHIRTVASGAVSLEFKRGVVFFALEKIEKTKHQMANTLEHSLGNDAGMLDTFPPTREMFDKITRENIARMVESFTQSNASIPPVNRTVNEISLHHVVKRIAPSEIPRNSSSAWSPRDSREKLFAEVADLKRERSILNEQLEEFKRERSILNEQLEEFKRERSILNEQLAELDRVCSGQRLALQEQGAIHAKRMRENYLARKHQQSKGKAEVRQLMDALDMQGGGSMRHVRRTQRNSKK